MEDGKAVVGLDLTPLVTLIEGVREDVRAVREDVTAQVRGVRDDVGQLSTKIVEISVDHGQRITRTEDRTEMLEKRVGESEGQLVDHARRIGKLEGAVNSASAVRSHVEEEDGRRTVRFTTLLSGVGVLMGASGWAVLIYYLVK